MTRVVVGIDGGGTHTRAMAADLTGRVLASVETGGSNSNHNPDARAELRRAICSCLERAGCQPSDVEHLVAGLAGLDSDADRATFDEFTRLDGLRCPRSLVNDAIVAHAAALWPGAGVVVICGTGCIVLGIDESGRVARNYDFFHYAHSAARHLGDAAVFGVLAGVATDDDQPLVRRILEYFDVHTVDALRDRIATNAGRPRHGVKREMSDLGPIVTAAAEKGVPLAREVCATAAGELAVGIGLVTGCLRTGPTTRPTRLALFGSVARTPVMRRLLMSELARQPTTTYEEVTPTFTPAGGAVSMALQRAGVTVDRDVTARLLAHPDARFTEL